MKKTLTIHLPSRFSHQYVQEGPAKPAGNFLTNRWRKTRKKNEIIEANYASNIHLTICSKAAFLNRDWSKLLPWIFANFCPTSSDPLPSCSSNLEGLPSVHRIFNDLLIIGKGPILSSNTGPCQELKKSFRKMPSKEQVLPSSIRRSLID